MKQLRPLVIAVLLALASFGAKAETYQDLGIGEVCQPIYEAVLPLIGKPGFQEKNEALLQAALSEGDRNAELQYYVLNLRNFGRGSSKEQVLEAMEALKGKAEEMGNDRFYFYAYTKAALYLTDIEQDDKLVLKLMDDMIADATRKKSDYGLYESNRYLSILYYNELDLISMRHYALDAWKIYTDSEDPLVQYESIIIRTLLDCSSSYPVENDSLKFFIDEARKLSKIGLDTLRCDYADSRYYAIMHDLDRYVSLKDKVRSNEKYYKRYYPEGDDVYAATDAALTENWDDFRKHAARIDEYQDIKYLSELASSCGNLLDAARLKERMIDILLISKHQKTDLRISEFSSILDNKELGRKLNATSTKLQRTSRTLLVLSVIFMLILTLFFIYYAIRKSIEAKEKEELIKELRKSRDDARRADSMKTNFVHNMSHEFRTPLNSIIGFSQLLAMPDGFLTDEEKQEFSEYVSYNGMLMTTLINDILNTADIESGNYSLNYSEFNIGSLNRFVLKSVEDRPESGVELSMSSTLPDDFTLTSDPVRIQQILINLLTNACKNTHSGTIVMECTDKLRSGFLTWSVTDTGIGVPEEKADLIFERFTKLDNFKQGTGLGLSISRLLANLLGGRLFLDKCYRDGARFVLEIPLNQLEDKVISSPSGTQQD